MTNRRRSATTRSVRAQTPEQLLELTQEYIRPLIGMIDELNEAGAEDELRVYSLKPRRNARAIGTVVSPQRLIRNSSPPAAREPQAATPPPRPRASR